MQLTGKRLAHCSTAILLSLSAQSSIAGKMGSVNEVKPCSWVASISAGPVWSYGGQTQTFYLAPGIEKTYSSKKSNQILAQGELFLGLQKQLGQQYFAQIGLAGMLTGRAKLSGSIWDDADPEFNNYAYNYRVTHSHLAVKGKLLVDKNYVVIPWVSGSIGVASNLAHHFDNDPKIFEAVKMPNFASHKKTTLVYTLGVGIQKQLTPHWQAGIGYEFADWGKSSLARAPGQTLGSGLKLDHLYTNGVLINATWIG